MKHRAYAFIISISLVFLITGCKTAEGDEETKNRIINRNESENSPIDSTAESVTLNDTNTSCDSLTIDTMVNTLSETISQSHENSTENESIVVEDTYQYKGINFKGFYDNDIFFVYVNSLDDNDETKHLIEVSYNATIAYFSNDLGELLKYFDNAEFIEEQKKFMQKYGSNDIDRIKDIYINHISIPIKTDNDFITLSYLPVLTTNEGTGIYYTLLQMYLNDDGDWKIKYIGIP